METAHIDIIGSSISMAAKITATAKANQVLVGELICDTLLSSDHKDAMYYKHIFKEVNLNHEKWKYPSRFNDEDIYRVYEYLENILIFVNKKYTTIEEYASSIFFCSYHNIFAIFISDILLKTSIFANITSFAVLLAVFVSFTNLLRAAYIYFSNSVCDRKGLRPKIIPIIH